MNFSQVRWKQVGFAIGIGVLAVLGATTAYANWQWRQGLCVRFGPDGEETLLYGRDCDLPSDSDSVQQGDQI